MPDPTIFHKILSREIPADIVYEDEHVLGFLDVRPKAPTHVLFIPKTFVDSLVNLTDETKDIPGQLFRAVLEFAKQKSIVGFKLQMNVGKEGGQEVMYLHLHFLSQQKI